MFLSYNHQHSFKTETNKEVNSTTNKIFRPWDKQSDQDSTISTTTSFDEKCAELPSSSSEEKKETTTSNLPVPALPRCGDNIPPANNDLFYSPEYLRSFSLAQSLGYPTNTDTLLLDTLDSLNHGYALEEYARVLSQEHHTKVLNSRKQRPKKYKCPHCDVAFSNNGQLRGHIRIHTGERPFHCDEANCGKTFTRNEELTRHKRIHSGLRPFPCTQCGKRFGRKDHLKKHIRTHLQPQGSLYAVPVMMPLDAWTAAAAASGSYPLVPMFDYYNKMT